MTGGLPRPTLTQSISRSVNLSVVAIVLSVDIITAPASVAVVNALFYVTDVPRTIS